MVQNSFSAACSKRYLGLSNRINGKQLHGGTATGIDGFFV
jgi:hypothetical protein